jgi:hypothetical protein
MSLSRMPLAPTARARPAAGRGRPPPRRSRGRAAGGCWRRSCARSGSCPAAAFRCQAGCVIRVATARTPLVARTSSAQQSVNVGIESGVLADRACPAGSAYGRAEAARPGSTPEYGRRIVASADHRLWSGNATTDRKRIGVWTSVSGPRAASLPRRRLSPGSRRYTDRLCPYSDSVTCRNSSLL